MDAVVVAGFKEGLSARLIADKIGVTRNSVLGRTFRLGLCQPRSARRAASIKARRNTLVRISAKEQISPAQLVERIVDMKDIGNTWGEIAETFGVTAVQVRNWAIEQGGFVPGPRQKFHTDEEIAYIVEAWQRNETLEAIADHLGRSYGVIRQTVHRLRKKSVIDTRDPNKTRLLRQYGETALAAGATATEALRKMAEAKQLAFAAATNASRAAKRKHHDDSLTIMRAALAAGADRDACIFAARAEGVVLEDIAAEIGVTRERIRQICNAHAQLIALRGLMA